MKGGENLRFQFQSLLETLSSTPCSAKGCQIYALTVNNL